MQDTKSTTNGGFVLRTEFGICHALHATVPVEEGVPIGGWWYLLGSPICLGDSGSTLACFRHSGNQGRGREAGSQLCIPVFCSLLGT